jgi:dihydrofolate synthase/folylpolyglutamate synthase
MRDKEYAAMLALLVPHVDAVLFAQPAMVRAASCEELRKVFPTGIATTSVDDALSRARRIAGKNGLVIVAGTIFLMSEVRARVLGLRSDPLIRM